MVNPISRIFGNKFRVVPRFSTSSVWFRGPRFPHFSRIISASTLSVAERTVLWVALTALFLVNIYAKENFLPSYWRDLTRSLIEPHSVGIHLGLAQVFRKEGIWPEAKRQLLLAQEFASRGQAFDTQVLGAATAPSELLAQWEQEPERLQSAYRYWQSVIREKPDYRDAYITLGAIAYQLYETDEAITYLNRAFALDPNASIVKELLGYITKQQ